MKYIERDGIYLCEECGYYNHSIDNVLGHDCGAVSKSLRDKFAMAALTGIYAEGKQNVYEVIARMAYAQADAMLKLRKGK